ncbi:MAG: DUF559 domain-containing protein [Bryobacteraceae bacterium]|nr:DUF559 domain-containing protein [Bryobacteraceae bacterium]
MDGATYALQPIAEKRGFQVFLCPTPNGRTFPDHPTRSKIERQVAKSAHEHIIIYTDAAKTAQKWQWVRRELGRPLARREYDFFKGHTGELLAQKLQYLAFELDEEERLTLVDVTRRARQAFDVDRVTKRFYDRFKNEHATFLDFVKGITATADAQWYASVMLNRLMFVYFIQKKGFLDGDPDYLRNRMKTVRQQKGKDKFHSFYRYFLLRLFHEGLGQPPAQRKKDLEALLGEVPYLNGGLFDVHELERSYPHIQIADEAFERLFDFFDAYQWHLDERPLRADNEINPDVLGYIFEKYVNQKQMGAYYTKEDITGYIARNTIIPYLFNAAEKKCAIAFKPDSAVWRLLRDDPDRYIYPAVKHGVIRGDGTVLPESELPDFVQKGMHHPKARMFDKRYNLEQSLADDSIRLVTETWREYVCRRQRCLEIRDKLRRGEVHDINDLITLNLDICQFAEDVIDNCEGPELLRAFWHAITNVSVLDPTCGSGAFLFAALNILEPLYEACLERMRAFLEDLERASPPSPSGRGAGGEGKQPHHPPLPPDLLDFARKLRREQTDAEKLMWALLRDRRLAGCKFRRQHPVEPYVVDFFCHELQLAIELDGGQHNTEEGKQHDQRRTQFLAEKGIRVLRFWNHDVLQDTDTVLQALWDMIERLKQSPSPPTPLPGGEGSKKFSDFRKILEDVARHPNHRYFILKSIIIGNLYGVDIMEEAVEICKLRLFLKLVAQVENAKQVEPLPDIDFNIRPGNTLVGFASLDEVKKTLQGNLGFGKKDVDRIIEEAEVVDRAFAKFRQMQTERGMDAKEFTAAKAELRRRLDKLRNELDRFLAGEYGVDAEKPKLYEQWRQSHQPFHWLAEFYGIMAGGGFDVIIGNPPYVEISDVGDEYQLRGLSLIPTGNLFAVCLERFLSLLFAKGHIGVITPISSVSTPRMLPLMNLMAHSLFPLFVSNFAVRPGKLFNGVDMNLSIFVGQRNLSQADGHELFSTRYNRWQESYRPMLFATLEYHAARLEPVASCIPKLGSAEAVALLAKLRSCPYLKEFLASNSSGDQVYYHSGGRYFRKCIREKLSNEYKELSIKEGMGDAVICLLSSSLYYWFWITVSDCYHVTKRDVYSMPVAPSLLGDKQLTMLAEKLLRDLDANARVQLRTRADGSQQKEVNFRVGLSRPVLDEIDKVLARHYGLSDEQVDWLLGFDAKYRASASDE